MAALKRSLGDEKKGKAGNRPPKSPHPRRRRRRRRSSGKGGCAQEGLSDGQGRGRSTSRRTTASATSLEDEGAARAQAQGQRRQLRRAEARSLAAALGLPARARRSAEELGRSEGPSLDPGEKRLAMRTEDHPLDYGDFEGTIPAGEYGGGTVMLWDQGRWIPDPRKDPSKTIEEGHLHFTLEGERMKGEWVLFRLKPKPGEKGEPWMLKKVTDEYCRRGRRRCAGRQCRDQRHHRPDHGRDRRRRGRLAIEPRRPERRPGEEEGGQGAAGVRGAAARDSGRRSAAAATRGSTNINMTATGCCSPSATEWRPPGRATARTGATSSRRW